jgi:hypothetical protein
MKITTITHIKTSIGFLSPGLVLEVDEENQFYVIKDGFLKGGKIHKNTCVPHKTYSEKEWNDMENHYMSLLDKEIAAVNRAVDMVASLGKQMVKKNAEIEKLEFCVSALSIGLSASGEAIQVLREKEKV